MIKHDKFQITYKAFTGLFFSKKFCLAANFVTEFFKNVQNHSESLFLGCDFLKFSAYGKIGDRA